MIPRSINRRQVESSISSEWDIENAAINNGNGGCGSARIDDVEEESEEYVSEYSEEEYKHLMSQVNDMYEKHTSIYNKTVEYLEYDALKTLKQDLDEYLSDVFERGEKPTVHICAYHVNLIHKYPFLEYFLFKNTPENGDLLHFPKFEYNGHMDAITKSITVIELLALSYHKEAEYVFKGYKNDDSNVYLFFDCSGLKLDGFKMSRMNDLWMVTIDEIVNHGMVCNFAVDESVVSFFKDNSDFLYLKDGDGNIFENPVVAYSGVSRRKLDFLTNFGIPASGNNAVLGNYYYFTDYQNAVKMSGWGSEENMNGGVIRFALFLGNMKVLLNDPNDDADDSLITRNMLLNTDPSSEEYKAVRSLLRISDRDGKWANDYDSVYVGKIDLDDGSVYEDYPLWVVKDYEQQVVLSNHIIDKKTLGRSWSRNEKYFTL